MVDQLLQATRQGLCMLLCLTDTRSALTCADSSPRQLYGNKLLQSTKEDGLRTALPKGHEERSRSGWYLSKVATWWQLLQAITGKCIAIPCKGFGPIDAGSCSAAS